VYFATNHEFSPGKPGLGGSYETEILEIDASFGCSGTCFGDSKRFGTMRVAHEDSQTGKLEQFAYRRCSPHAGSVPEAE
jgi:hypothetical protein